MNPFEKKPPKIPTVNPLANVKGEVKRFITANLKDVVSDLPVPKAAERTANRKIALALGGMTLVLGGYHLATRKRR